MRRPMTEPSSGLSARLRAWFDHPRSVQPSPSADGTAVYFVSDRGGHPEAWRLAVGDGVPGPFVRTGERVGRIQSCPFARRILLSTDRGGDEHWALSLWAPDGSRQRELTGDPTRIHAPGAWRDADRYVFCSNARDERFFDLYEVDVGRPDPPRRVREEDTLLGVAAARGDRLLLERHLTNIDTDLLLRTGSEERLLNPRSSEEAVFDADLRDDGAYAAANPGREFAGLLRYSFAGGTPELLYGPAGDVELVRADPAGPRVAVASNDRGYSRLSFVGLDSSEVVAVPLPADGVIGTGSWLADGSGFLFDLSAPSIGSEIFLADRTGRSVRPLTRSAFPMPGAVTPPTLEAFRAEDGLRIAYWDHRPVGPARGTIVLVHGGPESQARPSFSPLIQFLVGEGWRTVVPNVRGSLGYGRTFLHLDDVRRRMDSVRDLRDLAHALRDRAAAPPDRPFPLGIIGGSYGGFMVLSALTTYPDLWAAGVDVVGISNFVTFLERTGPWRRKVREDEYGSLANDREFLVSISPLHHADRIRAPLLVVHGANDPRVPIFEAEQIVATLESRRVAVEFLRFDDEGHGLVRRENQVRAYARAAEFFERYLGTGPAGSNAPARASSH